MTRVQLGTLCGVLLLAACRDKQSDEPGEGRNEFDPNQPPAGTGDDGDTGPTGGGADSSEPDDTGDTPEPDPTPTDWEVCYSGEDRSGTTCLPVVEWSADWGTDYGYPEPMGGDPQYIAPLRFIDLNDVTSDSGLMLAPNFALGELMQSWKGRYAIFQPHVVDKLQYIRDAIGGPLTINSGYRNVRYNADVGGATWSRHMYGDAADMGSSVASLSTLGSLCDELGAGYVGYYDSHVHCDWRASDLEPAFFAPDARLTSTQQGVWQVQPDSGPEGRFHIRWRALDERGQVIASATGSRWAPPRDTFLLEADVGGVKTLTTHHVTRP